ncbi:nucleoside diphosphate-linked moiety X motif 8 [Apteryx rowi]|uniref:nucleoside diphosphate-linked moiety X motif 8 n=1 Tax=Apteryx rowi TaxID=308060 RepID=UPI000E1DE0C7|nr:nucleoside diphosphate-linked moiety X motif 8 [Apteryx rowi]
MDMGCLGMDAGLQGQGAGVLGTWCWYQTGVGGPSASRVASWGEGLAPPPSLLLSRCASFQRGMMVAPVLANLGPLEDVTLTPNPQEVEEVFTVPLAHLLQAENQGYTHFRSKGRYSYTLPVFLNGPYKVWGLTAIITELTLELLAPDLYRRKTRVTGDR